MLNFLFSLLILAGVFILSVVLGFFGTMAYRVMVTRNVKQHQFKHGYTTERVRPRRSQFDVLDNDFKGTPGVDGSNALSGFQHKKRRRQAERQPLDLLEHERIQREAFSSVDRVSTAENIQQWTMPP